MEEKRQIKSAAELVNALDKGVGVEIEEWSGAWLEITDIIESVHKYQSCNFRYSDPVEVVELWSYNGKIFVPDNLPGILPTHKQTQIHQNGEIIWTETEKI